MGLLQRGGDKKKKASPKAKGGKKKTKRSSGGGEGMAKAKDWLMLNVEKLVLGLIGLTALALIYAGLSGTGLSETDGPEQLGSKLTLASSRLQPAGRDQLRESRYPEPDTFDQQATKDILEVDASKYSMNRPFFPLLQKQQKLRQDPKLLRPIDIIVRSGYGPLMLKEEASTLDTFSSNNSENVRSLPSELSQRWKSSVGEGRAKPVFFNSIVGIIPVREQLEAYNEAFIGAAEYELSRDFPQYHVLKIERREVGSADWTPLSVMENIVVEPAKWTGVVDSEIAQKYAPDYINRIVMPIPPIAGTIMHDFVEHPKLQTELEAEEESKAADLAAAAAEKELEARRGLNQGANNTYASGTLEMTDEEASFKRLETSADIGMFRYFDFEVEPGKSYEYRVKLGLEDPNNPIPDGGGTKPSHGALDPSVLVRLTDVVSSGGLASIRETEWTEPTAPVRVPNPGRAIIASAEAGSTIGKSEIPASNDGDPTAQVVAVGFDLVNGYVAPVEMEVTRGTLLNSEADTEVIDPSKNQIVKISNFQNKTGLLVVDIAGGENLTGSRRDPVLSPGKILMFAQDGTFIVSDELKDADEYSSTAIPENEDAIRERERLLMERRRRDEGGNEEQRGGRGERGGGRRERGEGRRGEGAL